MVLLPKRKSWVPRSNVSADHAYEVASRFEGLFSVVPRNESGVVKKRHVLLSRRHRRHQQSTCLRAMWPLIHVRYVSRLASRAKAMTEHETERGL